MARSSRGDRVVVVTGGSSGIGRACVARFRHDGDTVFSLDAADPDHPVDITDERAVEHFFDALPAAPHVLVNSAGTGGGGPIVGMELADWRRVLAVNLDGAFLALRAAARRMAPLGRGVVVNVTSINDRVVMNGHGAYCASKAALSILTRVAAVELGPSGVRVVGVAPGLIDTPLIGGVLDVAQARAAMIERTPLPGCAGTPDDVAALIAFLASDAARWITGDIVTVDGGQALLGFPDLPAVLARAAARGDAAAPSPTTRGAMT